MTSLKAISCHPLKQIKIMAVLENMASIRPTDHPTMMTEDRLGYQRKYLADSN